LQVKSESTYRYFFLLLRLEIYTFFFTASGSRFIPTPFF